MSLFSGLTFIAPVVEEKKVTADEAKVIAEYVTTLIANPNSETKSVPPAPVPPTLAPVIEKAVAAAQMGAKITAEKVAEITYTETHEVEQTVTYNEAQELLTHFEERGYVTKSGTVKDTMKAALSAGTLDLPAKFEAARAKFEPVISKANTRPPIQDASKEVRVRLKKQVMLSPEFLSLWDKIKGRTSYRVSLDESVLKSQIIEMLTKMERVPKARIVSRTARVDVENAGVSVSGEYERVRNIDSDAHRLPNFIRAIDDECFLSRRSAVEILMQSGRVQDYLNNPQKMTEMFVEAVRNVQGRMEIDGIRYQKLDGEEYYLQEIFDSEELIAYLDKNAIAVDNSIYDHIIYDSSTVERPFAVALDDDPDVKMFFKIPAKFKIETPIGTYNPDWAVYMDKDGVEKLYFVLETKGVSGQLGLEQLMTAQRQKIHCGSEHFKEIHDFIEWELCEKDDIDVNFERRDIYEMLSATSNESPYNVIVLQYMIAGHIHGNRTEKIDLMFDEIIDKLVVSKTAKTPLLLIINDIDHKSLICNYFNLFTKKLRSRGLSFTSNKRHFEPREVNAGSKQYKSRSNQFLSEIPTEHRERYKAHAPCSAAQLIIEVM